jgi:hypothetical protein
MRLEEQGRDLCLGRGNFKGRNPLLLVQEIRTADYAALTELDLRL